MAVRTIAPAPVAAPAETPAAASSPPASRSRLPVVALPSPAGAPAEATPAGGRLAAIDIGSNSIHMIVVAPEDGGGYRILRREKEMVRLGRSALGRGALSKPAIERGLEALLKMTTLARLKGADRAVAVATSAVREAANGREFLSRVKALTGLDVTLLSGAEEARLIHRAVREVVDLSGGTALILDVGGGSTEWIVSRDGEPAAAVSLPLGSLRCAGRLRGDPPRPEELAALREHVAGVLDGLPPEAGADGAERVICTSGTAATCAALADHLLERPAGPPGATLRAVRRRELRSVIDKLAALKRSRIAALSPVGGAERAESILAGAVVLDELLGAAGADRFEVCDRALRDGLVLEALGRPPAAEAGQEARRRQVSRLARRAESVYEHGVETARLAVRLFDLTASLHGLGAREREWLEYAALLHDVGYSVHYRGHHRHSYYLITHAGLDAFDPAEIEIIALVARYHRGRRPQAKRPDLASRPGWQRRTVRRLSALVRLGDALDRTHARRVENLVCAIGKKKVTIDLVSPWDVGLEIEAARERAPLFEQVFRRKLIVRQGDKRA
jgi:exopolyphosphatase/guanosine-5'-triphosphate,3'-diphosphate pyrophosphatase